MKDLTEYRKYRSEMKTGDLLEWRSDSLLGWSIRLFTGKKVNHTGIVFALDSYKVGGAHVYTIEAEPSGIEMTLLSNQLKKFDGEVYWYSLKKEFEHLGVNGIDWAIEQEGTDYDYKSLFKNAVSKVSADARKFFCSEFAFYYMVTSGMLPQYHIDNGVIKDSAGKPVTAPRPGEFDKYQLYNNPIRIL